jgi:hypothetical protein
MHRDVGGIKLGQYFSHEVAIGEVPGAADTGEDAGGQNVRTGEQEQLSEGMERRRAGFTARVINASRACYC